MQHLQKTRGEGSHPSSQNFFLFAMFPQSVPLQPNAFGATIRKGREISSRSEETTPLPSVSKTIERTPGTVRRRSRLPRLGRGCKVIALRSHLQERLGPSFYCWTAAGWPELSHPASTVLRSP